MIYTVTFNPSVDHIVDVEDFRLGVTNRACCEALIAGGKGLNVSMALKNLGLPSRALGFVAGFTGEEIRRQIEAKGIPSDFITVPKGASRINVKLKNYEGTEINGMGPQVGEKELEGLLNRLDGLKKGDVLVLSGSVSPGMPERVYGDILKRLAGKGVVTLVDAGKALLLPTLPYRPFLIKPNHQELREIFGQEITSREEAIPLAQKLRGMGAGNVLVSLGGQGAVLVAANGSVHSAPAPEGEVVNAVGAGDAMVAGFLAGWLEREDYAHAFKMGIAAGSASAFSPNFATRAEVEALYQQM